MASGVQALGGVIARQERAVEELGMSLEAFGLRDQLEPGPRHRLVVLAWDAGAGGDFLDPFHQVGEGLLVGVAALKTPGDVNVPLVWEGRAPDATGLEIINQEITLWHNTRQDNTKWV